MDETRLTNDATTSSKAKGNRSVIGKDGDCGEVIVNKGGGDGTGIGGTSADGLDLPGFCAVIRRARSGRTVRQMTTSVHVLELYTVYRVIKLTYIQFRCKTSEVVARYRKIPPYLTAICTYARPVLQAPDGPCLGGQRARAAARDGLRL